MGRKKKKELKPWCWYCNREFDEEKVLIYHQKAKHFKCHICGKKLYTGPGLMIHCSQVHRHTVTAISNALPHRTDPEVEIYGTEGIPFVDVMARARQKNVDIVVRDKNIANAALPAKYERTLDTPYGVTVERAVKPGSPSIVTPNAQPILKSFYTPISGESCTPGENSRPPMNNGSSDVTTKFGEVPASISANRIQLTQERCRIYHPIEDISLEEHRLRFSKYSKYDPNNKPTIQQYPTTQTPVYPTCPYPYYQQNIPGYPAYAYSQPPYPPPLPPEYQIPPPPIPYPGFQPPVFPPQPPNLQAGSQNFQNQQTGYYK